MPLESAWGDGRAADRVAYVWQTSVQASVAAFLDAVTASEEPPVTGADALETTRLLHRIYDSAVILRDATGP